MSDVLQPLREAVDSWYAADEYPADMMSYANAVVDAAEAVLAALPQSTEPQWCRDTRLAPDNEEVELACLFSGNVKRKIFTRIDLIADNDCIAVLGWRRASFPDHLLEPTPPTSKDGDGE